MTENVLAVRDIHKSFAGVKALKGVSLEIKPGETHCLAGENGSGKSTLIKIVSGVYTPDSGQIVFGDDEFDRMTPLESIDHGVQVIYQDFSIFPNLSVMENLALNSELAAGKKLVNWREMRKIAEEAVAKINFKIDLDAKIGDLSVADKQLVAISRALMSDAKLIIMDEPTTALTKKEVDSLFKVILDLKARGIAILFVSHKLEEVFEISDKFTILRNGEVVATKYPDELDRKSFSYYMTGREFEETPFVPENVSEEPILEAVDLSLQNGFSDVSFSLHKGEIVGLTGLLGSGRTELALTLFGDYQPTSGEIRVNGKPANLGTIRKAIGAGIGYVPEDRLTEGLFLDRSIGDNIVIAEIDELTKALGLYDKKEKVAEEEYWVNNLRIATNNPNNAASTLSGGNQQRIVLAKWLATKPEILILNGPTVGVDIGSKYDIHQILQNLAKEGLAVLIISDDIAEVLENSNRVLVMKSGQIVAEVDPYTTTEAELNQIMMEDSANLGVSGQ